MRPSSKPVYFGRDLEAMSSAKNYRQWIIDEFKPYVGRNVAEVGAGIGDNVELLLQRVRHLVAFEPSRNLYPLLKERFLQDPKIDTINDTFGNRYAAFKDYFDSILYINVLEHIEDEKRELAYVHDALKRGGHALIFVPALAFLYSDFDRKVGHLRRYAKKDLVRLVRGIGFRVVKADYFDFVGILPWYIKFVAMKQELTVGNVALYDKMVVPLTRLIEGCIAPPVGKSIVLVVQKVREGLVPRGA